MIPKRTHRAPLLILLAIVLSLSCHSRYGQQAGHGHAQRTTQNNHVGHVVTAVSLSIAGRRTIAERFVPLAIGPRPAVVLLYGTGGMRAGGVAYRWYAATLADVGIDTLICPYFDATHGRQHREPANTRIWIPAVRDTITYLQGQPNVAPDRIGIIGFSLGGFLGLSTVARDKRISALVDFFGPEPNISQGDWRHFPPTLILHGADDPIVSVANSRDVDAHLKAAGIRHTLVVYPGQHHGFTGAVAGDAHRRAVIFLSKELRP